MNIPPPAAKALSMWEYEALVYHWNKAHAAGGPGADHDPPPDRARMDRLIERINADPSLGIDRRRRQPMRA